MLSKIFYLVLLDRCFASSQPGAPLALKFCVPIADTWGTHKAWAG